MRSAWSSRSSCAITTADGVPFPRAHCVKPVVNRVQRLTETKVVFVTQPSTVEAAMALRPTGLDDPPCLLVCASCTPIKPAYRQSDGLCFRSYVGLGYGPHIDANQLYRLSRWLFVLSCAFRDPPNPFWPNIKAPSHLESDKPLQIRSKDCNPFTQATREVGLSLANLGFTPVIQGSGPGPKFQTST